MESHLKKLAEFYPVTSKPENVHKLLQYVSGYLTTRGMKVKMLGYNGISNLYAHPAGKKKSKLLLQAHVDVVPGEEQASLRVENGRYKARGVYDMLYATASYLTLVDELKKKISNLDLGIMLSGDEEHGGFNGVRPFLDDGYSAEVCILPDAGTGFGTLNISAKGVFNPQIRIKGAAHHGSRPWEGDGAAIKLVNFLKELEEYFSQLSQEDITMTVAQVHAGDAVNQGPAYADTSLDIRYKSSEHLLSAQKKIKELLKKYNGKIMKSIEGNDYHLDTGDKHVRSFIDLYEEHHGSSIEQVMAHGSSDARFFAEKNIPVIMLRPDGGGAHGDEEWISIESVQKFYELLKDFVISIATVKK